MASIFPYGPCLLLLGYFLEFVSFTFFFFFLKRHFKTQTNFLIANHSKTYILHCNLIDTFMYIYNLKESLPKDKKIIFKKRDKKIILLHAKLSIYYILFHLIIFKFLSDLLNQFHDQLIVTIHNLKIWIYIFQNKQLNTHK